MTELKLVVKIKRALNKKFFDYLFCSYRNMERIFTRRKSIPMLALVLFLVIIPCIICDIRLSTHDLSLKLNQKDQVLLEVSNLTNDAELEFIVQHKDIVKISPFLVNLTNVKNNLPIHVIGIGAGHSEIYANATGTVSVDQVYLRVTIRKVEWLDSISLTIGWIYFIAWSVSFYPQIYENWRRKSVVGLNFDFLALNLIGFTLYGIFNLGLYFIPEIQKEYFARYPRGLNPVQVNDIVFAVHATIATTLTIIQCYLYERAEQRVSITARCIIGSFGAFLLISLILASADVIHWLDFLYYCSYVKLTITLIKYIPQAYMNYKRKSTVGWSIGNIFLDFTGGSLSMLQMILNGYNYDDWVSIFGDITKFGLGLFSVAFDIFFMLQHYVFYRNYIYELS